MAMNNPGRYFAGSLNTKTPNVSFRDLKAESFNES